MDKILIQILSELKGLNEGQGRLETRMDGLGTKVDGFESRMDSFDTKLENLEKGAPAWGFQLSTQAHGIQPVPDVRCQLLTPFTPFEL